MRRRFLSSGYVLCKRCKHYIYCALDQRGCLTALCDCAGAAFYCYNILLYACASLRGRGMSERKDFDESLVLATGLVVLPPTDHLKRSYEFKSFGTPPWLQRWCRSYDFKFARTTPPAIKFQRRRNGKETSESRHCLPRDGVPKGHIDSIQDLKQHSIFNHQR